MSNTEHEFGFYDQRWGNPQWVWPDVKQYSNGRTAIQLYTYVEDNSWVEPWATATVNLPDVDLLSPHDVFIKDYAENEGLAELLATAGIIEPDAKRYFLSGFVTIGAYALTPEFISFIERSFSNDHN